MDSSPKLFSRLAAATAALCVFLAVLGAKWMTIDRFGSDIPNWDQWDAEGVELLAPWFAGDHFLQHLFHPHNEHRVVLTKLQALALVLLGGQWDSRVECVVNAVLHAALAAVFWAWGRRWIAPQWSTPLALLTAAMFGLPLAWENILGGFHSQQYWLLGLSFAAIAVGSFARVWSAAWWAAAGAAALALLAMGSGLLAAATVAAIVAFRCWKGCVRPADAWPTLIVAGAIVLAGLGLRVDAPSQAPFHAKSVGEFALYGLRSLAWPGPRGADWVALVLWLPWVLLTWRIVAQPPRAESRGAEIIVALGGWTLVQVLATAYARGAGANYPAPRYMDTLVIGTMANGLAVAWLLSPPETLRRPSCAPILLGLAWLVALASGLGDTVVRHLHEDLPNLRRYFRNAEAHLRGYLATRDSAQLAFDDIPYFADGLVERLRQPALTTLMPASVRSALMVAPAAGDSGSFARNDVSQLNLVTGPRHGLSPATPPLASLVTWGSFGANGAATTGRWTSRPLTAPLGGWLKIETAGDLGEAGVTLELRDALTGAHLADVRPTKVPRDSWRAAYVRAPDEPFVIVADDRDARRWLAFSAPVEMSRASYLAWQAAKHGWLLVVAGAVGFLLAAASDAWRRSASRR